MSVELNSRMVYSIIKEKGITHFYHANTVATSRSFIEEKVLFSREKMEVLGLEQTPQNSDTVDKKYNIYNFIFLDGLDLAEYFNQPNIYGPILFKFNIGILLLPEIPTVRITKINPFYWHDKLQEDEKYYTSCEELNEKYKTGDKYRDGNSCFVLTTVDGVLPFAFGLTEILIDDPKINNNKGRPVIELVRDYLFPNIEEFKKELPKVSLKKRDKFSNVYKKYNLSDLRKKYKRTFKG